VRLLLCDDHVMLLEALAATLAAHGHEVVATVADPERAADLAEQLEPDICILDIAFPSGDGISAVREIARRAPLTKVLMLSATSDPALVRAAFEAGATGFVKKDERIEEILGAVKRLQDGEVAVDPRLLRAAMRDGRQATPPGRLDGGLGHLTPRETEVLALLVTGSTTEEIGRVMGVATSTARTHIQNVLVKLGVHSRLQAAHFAVSHGLVEELDDGADWAYTPAVRQVR
jgi:two-component system, NarL family, nitrate/nitrite response regulator NarL